MANDEGPQPIATLAATPPFALLNKTHRQLLAEHARRREYASGDAVFRQGEDGDALFVIEQGWFKIVKTSPDGREQTLQVLGPGQLLAGLGVFVDAPNPGTALALEPGAAWEIPRAVVRQLGQSEPQLAWAIVEMLAAHLQHLSGLVEDLSLRTVEARLSRLLLEQAVDNVLDRHRWATQAEMATRLGTVPDVLQRTLRRLEGDGLIEVHRHEIRILDPTGLAARAT